MDNKRDFVIAIVSLLIVLIGVIVVIIMKWPIYQLLLILPSAIPHISLLYKLKNKKK